MQPNTKRFILPIIVLTLGIGHLLNIKGFIPQVDWLWTGLLGVSGLMLLALGKRDKMTYTLGPWLIVASISSILRETDKLDIKTEAPILIIALGAFLLISETLKLPTPEYLKNEAKDDD